MTKIDLLGFVDSAHQIQRVTNFHDLISTAFHGEINALYWKRTLIGDFSEIVEQVELHGNIAELEEDALREFQLSAQGQLARAVLLEDMTRLRAHGAEPTLNVIKFYERDDSFPFFPTDVYSFHVDRSPVPFDTFLCTYYGAPSEILPNVQAQQKVLIPEIRAELKKIFDGPDEGFETFLKDEFFDLHYQATPNAQPITLGLGHLCRLAIDHPESRVLPCVHRAPLEYNGQKRLLLIC